MCYYYSIGDLIQLQKWYGIKQIQLTLFDKKGVINGFSHPVMPVIKSLSDVSFTPMSWGLIPSWAKYDIEKMRSGTLNAKCETIFSKVSFKTPIMRKRCLIPAKYFVEWQHNGNVKQPYKIYVKDREVFSFGGIYDEWIDKETGEVTESYSIITTPANPLMEEIHNTKKRMPLILSKEDEEIWLSALTKERIEELMKPYNKEMVAKKIEKI